MPRPGKDKRPRLPLEQLVILAVARFSEPLALSSVFPYLPEMIKSFGVPKNEVAKWAGVTSAVFSFSQSLTAILWGRASDEFGRKPTIILGLFSTMICFLVWGFAKSLPMAIAARACLGAGNGNVGIIRTMVAEMVPEKELQPQAFSLMPLVWAIGSIFGPAFGGFFAKPAQQFPGLFGNSEFFKKYPFALPNIIASAFFLVSMTTAALFLKETLHHKRHQQDWGLLIGKKLKQSLKVTGRRRRNSFVDGEATAPLIPTKISSRPSASPNAKKPPRPSISEVFTPQTTVGLVAYTFLALHSVAYDQLLPVFLNYPVSEHTPENTKLPFRFVGGFGFESGQIGTIFTLYGIACGVIQFIVFPPLCTALGPRVCFRACAITLPTVYLITPFMVLIENETLRVVVLLAVMVVKAFAVIIGFPSITILLTNSASSLRILGTLNGFATTFSAIGRAVGPALTGTAFTVGVNNGYIVLPWFLMSFIGFIGTIPAWRLIEGDGPSASVDNSDDEDEDEDEADEESSRPVIRYDDRLGDEAAIASDSEEEDPYDAPQDRAESPLLPKTGVKVHYNTIQTQSR